MIKTGKNRVCQILGTEYPIIQGAMALIAESNLAGAVSGGGGLGIIASGGAQGNWVVNEIKKIRSMTEKPFGVNIMLLDPNVEEIIDIVCHYRSRESREIYKKIKRKRDRGITCRCQSDPCKTSGKSRCRCGDSRRL
jgi:NAD(P)H-dependent flavin oxidoreductase YrpB (nitropropane dioxygenase family)